jgi:hypothetical protein
MVQCTLVSGKSMYLYEALQTCKDPQFELKLSYVMWYCVTKLLEA